MIVPCLRYLLNALEFLISTQLDQFSLSDFRKTYVTYNYNKFLITPNLNNALLFVGEVDKDIKVGITFEDAWISAKLNEQCK